MVNVATDALQALSFMTYGGMKTECSGMDEIATYVATSC